MWKYANKMWKFFENMNLPQFSVKVACRVHNIEKTFCQNGDKSGYNFIKSDIIFMYILYNYKKDHYFKPI